MDTQISIEQREIIIEFVQECTDLLDLLEADIISLENRTRESASPVPDQECLHILHDAFRLFHSVKGGAAFLQFSFISGTVHAAEHLLDQICKGQTPLTSEHVNLFCRTCDFIRESLGQAESCFSDQAMAEKAEALTAMLKQDAGGESEPPNGSHGPGSSGAEWPSSPAASEQTEPRFAATPEMVQTFLKDASDLLQGIEQNLLGWSKAPDDQEQVSGLFRRIHSLKGNCGFLGLGDLERLCHRMESVLEAPTGTSRRQVRETLLSLCDVLKETLAGVARGGTGAIRELHLYFDLLDELMPPAAPPSRVPRLGEILVGEGVITAETLDEALDIQHKPLGEVLVGMQATTPEQVARALSIQSRRREPLAGIPPLTKRQDLRVDLEKIDTLINLIGELVIAENMLVHSPDLQGLELDSFNRAAQQMRKLVKELQEVTMNIRMIPVAGLFNRMARLVHDLSRKSGKQVELLMNGVETELDKTVIEKITDPMVHLIRNAMDHGLEDAKARLSAGKEATGTVQLTAGHEEGEVLIKIKDDGRGLDRAKILRKAIEKGLIPPNGTDLTDQELTSMIFLPGFSTTDQVTDISGRGVGMDVVRQNLQQLNGKIEVESRSGSGTEVTLRIPLTMAIIEGMLVRVGSSRYILPILPIRESFQPVAKAITISPNGLELVRVRDHLYPILRLHQLHGIRPDSEELNDGILILLEHQGRAVCLLVDEILGQQQTVIKGLSEYIGKIGEVRCVSGCTILGDGEVCLILEVAGLTEISLEPTGK